MSARQGTRRDTRRTVLAGVADLSGAAGRATATALATELRMPVNTIRFHLARLVRDGEIVADHASSAAGPGRPAKAYRPRIRGNDQAAARNDHLMAVMLAGVIAAHVPDVRRACLDIGQQWGRFLAKPDRPVVAPDSALADLTRVLTDLGFDPQLSADGTRVDIFNCPFRGVAEAQQEVACTLHLGLMRGVLEQAGNRITAQRLDPFVQPGLCVARLGSHDDMHDADGA